MQSIQAATSATARAELLIILTPKILKNETDTDTETDEQLKRLKLMRQSNGKAAKNRASAYLMDELTPLSERKGAKRSAPGPWPGISSVQSTNASAIKAPVGK